MTGAVSDLNRSSKRKRVSMPLKASKRTRSESTSSDEDEQAQILLLENEVFESKKNYNNIANLISILRDDNEDPEKSVVAAISLCRVFTRLMVSGDMNKKKETTEKEVVVIRWLKERYFEYKAALIMLLGEEGVDTTALTLCMRLLKTEGQHLHNGQQYSFPTSFLTEIVQVLLNPNIDGSTRREFSNTYAEENDDIRFYTFEAVEKLLKESEPAATRRRFDTALEILKAIESIPDSKEELEDFYVTPPQKTSHALFSLYQHKKRAQGAWLALMSIDMDKEQRKAILGLMAESIAPWFIKPELLMDFLTDSYNTGGTISLLALSGVFYLIQEKNLDYPSFYRKLYSLLDADVLHSKHRSKFFRLLNTFLASTHLPAVLVASFVKRLSRLALNASPAGFIPIVPWIYNLLKKHPTCTFMIHRVPRTIEERRSLENEVLSDPFLMDEEDPMETHALDSCLWEIVTLQSHYHPNLATVANIISEQFTKHAYNLEDFLDHTYATMLEAWVLKENRKIPVVEFEIPKKIFMKQDVEPGVEESLVVKLWDWSGSDSGGIE